MASISNLPFELSKEILENLHSLADLQAAILASKRLFETYQMSRTWIRKGVFRNEAFRFQNGREKVYKESAFRSALGKIYSLEKRNLHDGFILRQALWADYVAYQASIDERTLDLYQWSKGFIETCRSLQEEQHAQSIEIQTVYLLCLPCPDQESTAHQNGLLLGFLDFSLRMSNSKSDIHRLGLCQKAWEHLITLDQSYELTIFHLMRVIPCLCRQGIIDDMKIKFQEFLERFWDYLRRVIRVLYSDAHFYTLQTFNPAAVLTVAYRTLGINEEVIISLQKSMWKVLPRRSWGAKPWAKIMIQSYGLSGKRLDGLFVIWDRLREVDLLDVRGPEFGTFDLELARDIIREFTKLGYAGERLVFQASVLELMTIDCPAYYAWGRNLSDFHIRVGDLNGAIRVQERMWQSLTPKLKVYSAWGRELIRLYRKIGRDEDANLLQEDMKKELQVQEDNRQSLRHRSERDEGRP